MNQSTTGQTRRFYKSAILTLFAVFAISGFSSVNQVEAATYLNAGITTNCVLMNNCTWWYGNITPTAPTDLGFTLSADTDIQFPQDYFHNGQIWLFNPPFNFSLDCNNDGNYGDGSVSPIYNPFADQKVTSGSCNIPKAGRYTVGVKIERNGLVATSSITFSIGDRELSFWVAFPAGTSDYKPPINDQSTGWFSAGTVAPANVDLLIGMKDVGSGKRYQNDYYVGFDDSPFSWTVDCNGDGKYDDGSGNSNNGANGNRAFPGLPPIWTGGTYADNVCRMTKPGKQTISLKITMPYGKEYVFPIEVLLINNQPMVVSVYPDGKAPGEDAYVFNLNQQVPMTVKVTGLNSNNSGLYNTTINCGNGQIVSGPGANGRNYVDGMVTGIGFGPCIYTKAGTYNVVTTFQENKPASEPFPAMSGTSKTKIVVTGEGDVTSPFYLEWNVSRATSCVITGPDNFFGLPVSGKKSNIKRPVGTYNYKLICKSSSGGPGTEQDIKVNVIYEMNDAKKQ